MAAFAVLSSELVYIRGVYVCVLGGGGGDII